MTGLGWIVLGGLGFSAWCFYLGYKLGQDMHHGGG